MQDNLIHELIHVLLTQNISSIKKDIQAFHVKFTEFNFTTRIHILVHAIHLELAQTLYPSRVKAIQRYSKSKDYRTSWRVVRERGSGDIIGYIFK